MSFRNYISLFLFLSTEFCIPGQAQDPEPPVIRYVSVDTLTGDVIINWEKGSGSGIINYVVYQGREGSVPVVADPIDTLDASLTSYVHSSSAAETRSVSYTVASVFAEDTSPLAAYHSTIYTTLNYDSCQNSLIIEWTPYIGWNDNLFAYNIYIRTGSGGSTKISSLSPATTNYTFTGAIPYTDYCVFVEAENRNFLTSTSNKGCLNTDRASPPTYINADFASVTGNNTIQLSFSFDRNTQVHDFILLFGRSIDNILIPVAEFSNNTSGSIGYTHEVFSVRKKNYYQLTVVDQCPEKNPLKKSNIASNFILEASENNKIITLQWGDYQEWQAGVKYYHVYRITDETNIEQIDSLNYGINTITDDLLLLRNNGSIISDEICYYIVAEENDDNIYGIKGYSRSNTVCISVVPEIYMANAFTPDGNGSNDKIKPLLTFLPEKYLFSVYDRWGSKIFETENPDEYWNGDINDKKNAPPGVYTYYLKITSSDNIVIEKKGTITLFYP
jgi:gliding motility-associated-like protein